MHKNIALLGLVAATVAIGSVRAQDKQTGTLKFRAFKSFDFVMPTETWTKVEGSIKVKHPGGEGFRTARTGLKLEVDTTGDGRMTGVIKGQKGYLKLTSKSDKSFQYAARFRGGAKGYEYASSCAMSGSVGGVPVQVFDLNNNGIYNEYGTDAMIVGKGKAASYLSKVISHGSKLYNFEISENGAEASTTPYDGAAGTLSLASGFHGKGKLEAAIVSDGANSFNVAGVASMTVPAGDYTIVSGFVKKGSQTVRVRGGKMAPIAVKGEAIAKLTWGGPVMAEFSHTLAEGKVTVEPTALKFYGQAGEEYYDWYPNAKSPKFSVRDSQSGKEVGSFVFGGC